MAFSCCRPSQSEEAVSYKQVANEDQDKTPINVYTQTDPTFTYSHENIEGLTGDPEKMPEGIKSLWKAVEEIRKKRAENETNKIQMKLEEIKKGRTGWKTIRIFVSSTFKDFHSEREALVKKVFPNLREWCQQRQLHLVECDLRWGVPEHATTEVAISICLEEIDRCIKDNVLPFFLNMTSERVGWIPEKKTLSDNFIRQYNWEMGFSVTEMEIVRAAFGHDNPNALFMIRDETFLDKVPNEHKAKFRDPGQEKMAPSKNLALKEEIISKFPKEQVHSYQVEYVGEDEFKYPVLKVEEEFCKTVLQFFKDKISGQYPQTEKEKNRFKKSKKLHENFFQSRAEFVIGRDDILEKVKTYVSTIGQKKEIPLVLVGEPGMGKSSIMAAAVKQTVENQCSDECSVFYHFTGAVPESTDLFNMLSRLLTEMQVIDNQNMPKDLETARQETYSFLTNPNQTKKMVIFVDAVNQFADEEQVTRRLTWLPKELPAHIRCIISTITNTSQHKCFQQQTPSSNEVVLQPLTIRDKKNISIAYLERYGKTVDVHLFVDVVEKASSDNPLWLILVCEELRIFGLFRHMSAKSKQLKDGLKELGIDIVKRLVMESDSIEGALLMAALCLIQVTPGGLFESELKEILADKDFLNMAGSSYVDDQSVSWKHGMIYDRQWAVVYRGLRAFIRPIGDSGEGLLGFYHQSLSDAVHNAYFDCQGNHHKDKSPARNVVWYEKLAAFFEKLNSVDRKVEVLPHCYIQRKDTESLKSFLSNWGVFYALFNKEYSAKLVRYWQKCCSVDETFGCHKAMLDDLPNNRERAQRHFDVACFLQQAGAPPRSTREIARRSDVSPSKWGESSEKQREDIKHEADVCSLLADLYYQEVQDSGYLSEEHEEPLLRCVELHERAVKTLDTVDKVSLKKFTAIQKMKLGTRQGALASVIEADEEREKEAENLIKKARQNVEAAREIFKEENDKSRQAEACMSLATLYDGKEKTQVDLYKKALKLCTQANGDIHTLTYRIHFNTAICYQRAGKWDSSYDEYKEAYNIAATLFGESHRKTKSVAEHLKEDHNQRIAQQRNDKAVLTLGEGDAKEKF